MLEKYVENVDKQTHTVCEAYIFDSGTCRCNSGEVEDALPYTFTSIFFQPAVYNDPILHHLTL